MSDYQARFQQLLRKLFQFDCADLDFGIYRIMNYKRAVIERFISKDLPRAIAQELEQGALAAQAQARQDLEAARKKVLEALGEEAVDADGNLAALYQNTNAGKAYLAAQERAKSAKSSEALEAAGWTDTRIEQGDSFHNNRFSDLKADYILANPPFNVSDWGGEHLREDKRWKYGIPPLRAIHTTFVEEALTWKMAN